MQEKTHQNLAKIVIIFLGIFIPSFIFLGLLQGPIYSASSDTINLQGKIVRNDVGYEGLNISTGSPSCVVSGDGNDTCDFRVRYYDAPTAGNLLLTEQFSNVEIGQYVGVFNVSLGSDPAPVAGVYTSLSSLIEGESDVYVEVGFDPSGLSTYTEVFSRMPLEASGYAIRAKYADSATGATELAWSGLKSPTGNLSLQHSTYTTLFNWATGTGTNNLFSLTSDASSNGTGALMNVQTGVGSTLIPLRVRAGSTEAIYVNSSGNVGVGTMSPSAKLDVAGDQYISGFLSSPNIQSGNTYEESSTIIRNVNDPAGWVKIWDSGGGSVYTSNFRITGGYNNKQNNLEFRVAVSGYGQPHSIVMLPTTNYNGGVVEEIRTQNVSITQLEVWIKLEAVNATQNGSVTVYSTDSRLVDSLTLTTTEPTWLDKSVSINPKFDIGNVPMQMTSRLVVPMIKAGNSNGLYLVDDANNGLFVEDGGQIGIGTTSPAIKLAIGDTDTGLHWISDGNLAVYTNNVERIRINSSGNVGIGTTSPTRKLHVQEADFADVPLFERTGITTNTPYLGGGVLATKTTDMGDGFGSLFGYYIQDDAGVENPIGYIGAVRAGADTTGDLVFHIINAGSNSEAMRIDSTGYVGIGTDDPLAKLNVKGNQILLKNEADADLGLVLDSGSTTTYRDVIYFKDRGTDIFGLEKTSTNAFQLYDYAGGGVSRILVEGGANSGISFRSKGTGDFSFANDLTTMVTIDETGKVGIGTAAPSSLLSVGSTSQFQVDSSGDIVKIKNLSYSWPTSHTTNAFLKNDGSGNLTWTPGVSGSGSAGQATFWTGTNTISGDNDFWWDNTNKRLGVGTSTPGYKLDVRHNSDNIVRYEANVIPANQTGSYTWKKDAYKDMFMVCQFGTCCAWDKDCDGDGRTYKAGNDCDEGCNTCYVGSTSYTSSPDGKDQDCDGVVDEDESVTAKYYLFHTSASYTGYLDGRSGADTKCNSDSNKPATCSTSAWAFISVYDNDEVRDMPTTKNVDTTVPWVFKSNGSSESLAAVNWADLLDGSVQNKPSSGGLSNTYWSGSKENGAIAYTCNHWMATGSYASTIGQSTYTDYHWLWNYNPNDCSYAIPVLCACKGEAITKYK